MNKSVKSSKKSTMQHKTPLSCKELKELETLRRQIFGSKLDFSHQLIRCYLDSSSGQDLEKKIYTAIS